MPCGRSVGLAPKHSHLAIEQTSGRQRINIHGAIDLQTGQTRMLEALTVDAVSTIRLLEAIEALYPLLVLIHVFLDNARYHHAKIVQAWLDQPGRRIILHFIPATMGQDLADNAARFADYIESLSAAMGHLDHNPGSIPLPRPGITEI